MTDALQVTRTTTGVTVINAGPVGPQGPAGPTGPAGGAVSVSDTRSLTTADTTAALAIARFENYHSNTNPYQWNDVAGLPLRAAWHRRPLEPFTVAVVSHSIGVGFYAGSPSARWVDTMADHLCAAAGQATGQPGYISAHSLCSYAPAAFTRVGSVNDRNDIGLGLGGADVLDTASLTYTWFGDAADVFYPTFPGWSGQIKVVVDAVQVQLINTGGAPAANGRRYRWAGTSGTHTMVLSSNTAATYAPIEGAAFWNGNSAAGVQVVNGSHFGFNTANFAGSNVWAKGFDTIAPKVVLVALQTNDQALTAAQYITNLTTIIATIRANAAVATKPPTIILCVPLGAGATAGTPSPFERATWKVGLDNGCMVLDWAKLGGFIGTGGDAYGLGFDGVHPNDYGHALMGQAAAAFILDAVGAPRLGRSRVARLNAANVFAVDGMQVIEGSGPAASGVAVRVTGDAFYRSILLSSALWFGGGSSAYDAIINRVSPGVMGVFADAIGTPGRLQHADAAAANQSATLGQVAPITGATFTGNVIAPKVGVNASAWGTVEKLRVNTPTTVNNTASAVIAANAATDKPLVVQGAASQSANLQEWQSSGGTILSYVDYAGTHRVTAAGYGFHYNDGGAEQSRLGIWSDSAGTTVVVFRGFTGQTANLTEWQNSAGTPTLAVGPTGAVVFADGTNITAGVTTGTKIGTSNLQKLALWGNTPIVQPTTAFAAAAFVVGVGTAVNDASTFDGYTIKQVVAALRAKGDLA